MDKVLRVLDLDEGRQRSQQRLRALGRQRSDSVHSANQLVRPTVLLRGCASQQQDERLALLDLGSLAMQYPVAIPVGRADTNPDHGSRLVVTPQDVLHADPRELAVVVDALSDNHGRGDRDPLEVVEWGVLGGRELAGDDESEEQSWCVTQRRVLHRPSRGDQTCT